jgi:hypothetical protein
MKLLFGRDTEPEKNIFYESIPWHDCHAAAVSKNRKFTFWTTLLVNKVGPVNLRANDVIFMF